MILNERTFRASEAHKLEDPERLKWFPPAEIIGRLELKPGATVADVGAGTGFFAIPLAELLRHQGRLAIVDRRHDRLPPPGPPTEHRLAINDVVTLLRQSGWKIQHSAPVAACSYMIISTFPG